ncbi:methyltransferase domain-containing protein [Pseudenhygromyxa sp. WMMC2535]|uniref:methyltransferase domain-containing protein n=1 Tax=Pseudenhygromyxa sp. WMMC2535 TaxID=2712867 RepID=UPI001C3E2EBE|nr:methyltransferase domain-containing protein [Pseudenhygromyxa sp. WMMC2535]
MNEDESRAWNSRYAEGTTHWDLGGAPPVLEQLIARQRGRRRVLVPGAGHGHDALAWAAAGHEVVALDFAPLAVASMRERASQRGVSLEVLEADVTRPPASLRAGFDLVWEQTCLCALEPQLRRPYLEQMAAVLHPEGRMVALLWSHGREGGPPYDMAPGLVERLVAGLFSIERREPVSGSIPEREPEALWWLAPLRR